MDQQQTAFCLVAEVTIHQSTIAAMDDHSLLQVIRVAHAQIHLACMLKWGTTTVLVTKGEVTLRLLRLIFISIN